MTGVHVSPRTTRRVRKTPLAQPPVREAIERTRSQGDRDRLLLFARTPATDDFHCDAFTDGAFFGLDNTGRLNWHKRGESHPSREMKVSKVKILTWRVGGWWGKSELCICEEAVTARYYI